MELFDQFIVNAQQHDRWANAYIFVGQDADLLFRRAARMARLALCHEFQELFSKGKECLCETCQNIIQGRHSEVHWFEGSSVNMEKARELTRLGRLRVKNKAFFIFKDADKMSEGVCNALLKFLEEPAEGVSIILLTSSPDSIIRTVRSRSLIVFTDSWDLTFVRRPQLPSVSLTAVKGMTKLDASRIIEQYYYAVLYNTAWRNTVPEASIEALDILERCIASLSAGVPHKVIVEYLLTRNLPELRALRPQGVVHD